MDLRKTQETPWGKMKNLGGPRSHLIDNSLTPVNRPDTTTTDSSNHTSVRINFYHSSPKNRKAQFLDRLFMLSQNNSIEVEAAGQADESSIEYHSPVRRCIVGQPIEFQEQELKKEFSHLLEKKLLKMQRRNFPIVFKDARTKQVLEYPMTIH